MSFSLTILCCIFLWINAWTYSCAEPYFEIQDLNDVFWYSKSASAIPKYMKFCADDSKLDKKNLNNLAYGVSPQGEVLWHSVPTTIIPREIRRDGKVCYTAWVAQAEYDKISGANFYPVLFQYNWNRFSSIKTFMRGIYKEARTFKRMKGSSDLNRDFALQHSKVEPLPKIIWTYWNSQSLPLFVRLCIEGWKRLNPDYTVVVLTPQDFMNHLETTEVPSVFDKLSPQAQSDWLKLAFMKEHGGFWFDASTILTKPIDWMQRQIALEGTDGLLYYFSYNMRGQIPTIENWFMSAKPNAAFINKWFDEFDRVVIRKHQNSIEYSKELKKTYGSSYFENYIRQHIDHNRLDYFTQHLAAQKVLAVDLVDPNMSLLNAVEAEGPFKMVDDLNFNPEKVAAMVCDKIYPEEKITPFIKFIGQNRNAVENRLAKGKCLKGTICDVYLKY